VVPTFAGIRLVIPFIIFLFVDAQDVTTAWPAALARAAEEALGSGATVSVRSFEHDTPAPTLIAEAQREGAAAVARVSWAGAQRSHARLEVTLIENGRTLAEGLTFEGSDPLAERGRSLGLVLAALVKRQRSANAEPRAETPGPGAPVATTSSPPTPTAASPRWALDAAAEAALAASGAGSGVGGAVGLRWLASRRVGVRVGARGRFGQVGAAQGALTTLSGAAGVTVSVLQPGDGERLGLGVRGEALLLYESISHLSSDDPEPVRRGRLLPGASVVGELSWSLSPAVSLLLAAGPEVAFGTTHVFVHQAEVAELGSLRLVIQAGVLASF
jgi:hypothetical protein